MNWEAIGAVGEVAGAIAVVATLFYLANQIRNSSMSSNADTERQLLSVWDEAFKALSSDQETASIMTRGVRDVSTLTEEELYRFMTRIASIMSAHFTMYRMRDHNFIGQATREGTDASVVWLLKSKGGQFWWKHYESLFPHADYVNELLRRKDIDVPPYDVWWDDVATDAKKEDPA